MTAEPSCRIMPQPGLHSSHKSFWVGSGYDFQRLLKNSTPMHLEGRTFRCAVANLLFCHSEGLEPRGVCGFFPLYDFFSNLNLFQSCQTKRRKDQGISVCMRTRIGKLRWGSEKSHFMKSPSEYRNLAEKSSPQGGTN
jgi:hypothetical protein